LKESKALTEMVSPKALTFRVRECPASANEAALRDMLAQAFSDIQADDIHVRSIAMALSPWEAPPTKTATVNFEKLPSDIETKIEQGQWSVKSPHQNGGRLILDTHFFGLTPLNDVPVWKHGYE
jgi:hypothetical protein